MGVVWLARDQELHDRAVALKFLPETLACDPVAVEQLRREAEALLDLNHPSILRLQTLERWEGMLFLVLQWLAGPTLQGLLAAKVREGRRFEVEEVLWVLRQVAAGLDHAHGRGMLHRDLKPGNLILTEMPGRRLGDRGEEVRIADFGLAYVARSTFTRMTGRTPSGTLPYMAPEVLLGKLPTVASDVYGLGATVYHLVRGKPPFGRRDVSLQVCERLAPALRSGSPALDEAVRLALEKDPHARPRTGGELFGIARRRRLPSRAAQVSLHSRLAPSISRKLAPVLPPAPPQVSPPSRNTDDRPKPAAVRPHRGRGGWLWGVALAVSAGGGWWILGSWKEPSRWFPRRTNDPDGGGLVVESTLNPSSESEGENVRPQDGPKGPGYIPTPRPRVFPPLLLDPPLDDRSTIVVTREESQRVRGKWLVHHLLRLALSDLPARDVEMDPQGYFDMSLPLPREDGLVRLRFLLGKDPPQVEERSIIVDRTLPRLKLTRPEGNVRTANRSIAVEVLVDDANIEAVEIGQRGGTFRKLRREKDGRWGGEAVLGDRESEQSFVVRASDRAGNVQEASFQVEHDAKPPFLLRCDPASGEWLHAGSVLDLTLHFDEIVAAVRVEGVPARPEKESKVVRASLHVPGKHTAWHVAWVARDRTGNESSGELDYDVLALPQGFCDTFDIVDSARSYRKGGTWANGEYQPTGLPVEVRHKRSGMVMRLVPAGRFAMGACARGGVAGVERKQFQEETIPSPFYMGKYEVTWEEWDRNRGSLPVPNRPPGRKFQGKKEEEEEEYYARRPVVNVSWTDCKRFCDQLGLRLPAEAEWEYAARGGAATRYPWGDDGMADIKKWAHAGAHVAGTSPVGELLPNALGLYDVIGNVWEWCEDLSENGPARVIRGGAYSVSNLAGLSFSHRAKYDPSQRSIAGGFRVVVDP